MKGFRRLLIPLDFSPASTRVLEAALRVAEEGAHVQLLHVVEWVPSVVEGALVGYSNPRDVRDLHHSSIRKLEGYARLCTGVETSVDVIEGQPARAILEAAQRVEADLIVLGRSHHQGIAGIAPGNVVERVLRRASCPVLIVNA